MVEKGAMATVELRMNGIAGTMPYQGKNEMEEGGLFQRGHTAEVLEDVSYPTVQLWYGNEYIAFETFRFLAKGDVVTFKIAVSVDDDHGKLKESRCEHKCAHCGEPFQEPGDMYHYGCA